MGSIRTLFAVMLPAVGCTVAGPTSPPPVAVALASLEGTPWRAEEIDGAGVVDGAQATVIFDAGHKVAGRAACNRYFGVRMRLTAIPRLSAEAEPLAGRIRRRP